jgi:YfiH family protein
MLRALDVGTALAATLARLGSGVSVGTLGKRPAKPLRLYEFEGCPFCRKVREALSILDLDAEVFPCPKNGKRFRPEVVKKGGKAQFPWLVHGFSTRTGGTSRVYGGNALNLGITEKDTRAAVERNRAAFLKALNVPEWPVVSVRQIHSDLIWPVPDPLSGADEVSVAPNLRKRALVPQVRGAKGGANLGVAPVAGDGLVTDVPGQLLAIRTADCLPLLLVDAKKRAIGAFHAGWRGTLKRIAEKGVGEMRRWFGSRPEDLHAAIGPCIHSCCFEVGEEVRDQFQSQFEYADALFTEIKENDPIHERYPLLFLVARAPGHIEPFLPVQIKLDLVEANRRQLLAAGVRPRRISASPLCTACHADKLFSHRAEHGVTGRMMAVIGIRP